MRILIQVHIHSQPQLPGANIQDMDANDTVKWQVAVTGQSGNVVDVADGIVGVELLG